jgi:hypothetical protein
MRLSLVLGLFFSPFLFTCTAQAPPGFETSPPHDDGKLPNGKDRAQEILKAEHERTLDDARQLVSLSQALQKELEQSGAFVVSMSELKKTDEIEKLARRIRSRMKH